MEITEQLLMKIPIFKGLKEEHLKIVKEIIEIKEFEEDTAVIKEGEAGDEIYILLDGEVEVSKTLVLKLPGSEIGQKEKSLTKLSSESFPFFGEMVLFDERAERTATVITRKPCKFAIIHKNDFINLAEKNNEIGYVLYKNIAEVLAERLRKANNDILKLTTALSLILSR
ncbi:cyclic nucleotide-binding domain-containing protein [Candidatus Chrysopegis kryptomonas]|uniref:Cyclic nucleotide-binding domain-containing protein n=1 Tax=Candidatus Chryseopegocella kryptomonas TaxID=1633643 RepID=A0A0N7MXQ6_9BACT|nr:cyclic nucleotide-binding domain-containing protein [Candidatus Chrysopegis kryptomonas]CUT02107.1 Cyclic nucleotide-binding domain-containing protein [Candidatus Chrysopegis kryptomonas]